MIMIIRSSESLLASMKLGGGKSRKQPASTKLRFKSDGKIFFTLENVLLLLVCQMWYHTLLLDKDTPIR